MGYKYNETEILDAAVQAALEDGLSRLTFGRLAKRLGIADRSIVYYFPTKADLLTQTIARIGGQLKDLLEDGFGAEPLSETELLKRAWPTLTGPHADEVFAIFFELVGLGAARIDPFEAMSRAVMSDWLEWVIPRIDAPDAKAARSAALSLLATLDGLLLIRHTLGEQAAEDAAANLGITH